MSDKDPRENSNTSIATIVFLLTALAAGLALRPGVPDSSRPPSKPAEQSTSRLVEARLWQNPLDALRAVQAARNGSTADQAPPDTDMAFANAWSQPCNAPPAKADAADTPAGAPGGNEELRVLAFLLPGGSYSEDDERNRRARSAVLGALARWRYEPDNPNHLRTVQIRPCDYLARPAPASGDATSAPPGPPAPADAGIPGLDVAVEEFDRLVTKPCNPDRDVRCQKDKFHHRVRIYWISDELLRRDDLGRFDDVTARRSIRFGNLISAICSHARPRGRLDVQLVGPLDENLAEALYAAESMREPDPRQGDPGTGQPYGQQLGQVANQVSKACNAPRVATLVPFANKQLDQDHQRLRWISWESVAPANGLLAQALVSELEFRGLQLREPVSKAAVAARNAASGEINANSCRFRDHVALINEWDSDSSRDFREEFQKDLMASHQNWVPGLSGDTFNLHGFSFTRGLDGKGKVVRQSADNRDSDGSGTKSTPRETPMQAFGESQRDYLGRLALEIRRRDEALKEACTTAGIGIKAVGILASDFHDKLMLLKTLRSQLPDAVFFTTQIDARLLDADNTTATRNLIVASHYGLSLAPAIQRYILPFRDSAQTALFLTTSVALARTDYIRQRNVLEQVHQWRNLRPQVFEVGFSNLHPLGPYNDFLECRLGDKTESFDNMLNCETLHPRRMRPSVGGLVTAFVEVGVLLIGVMLVWATVSWRFQWRTAVKLYLGIGLALALPLLYFAWVEQAYWAWQEEPLVWFDGVSAWPTMWLRWATFVVAIAFIVTYGRWRAAMRYEPMTMVISGCGEHQPTATTLKQTLWRWLRVRWRYVRIGARRHRVVTLVAMLATQGLIDRVHQAGATHALPQPVRAIRQWRNFVRETEFHTQLVAACIWSVLVLAFLLLLNHHWPTYLPIRGAVSRRTALFIGIAAFLAFLVLFFLSVHTLMCIRRLADHVTRDESDWGTSCIDLVARDLDLPLRKDNPHHFLDSHPDQQPELLRKACDHYVDIRVIGYASGNCQFLLYAPGIVLALLIAARSPVFDDWRLDMLILTIYLMFSIAVSVTIWAGQHQGEVSRHKALDMLMRERAKADYRGQDDASLFIGELIRRVQIERGGIFAPAWASMLRGLTLPTIGYLTNLPFIHNLFG